MKISIYIGLHEYVQQHFNKNETNNQLKQNRNNKIKKKLINFL